ncbi:hypothetical protein BXZ70DRAFT_908019 [Cristinia sonorae]|uniref:CCHC-type domain-containing protein n=1 Tax=Cristinia sonorae TaxID=1940300 RepID=A0A8K0UMH3_9AGAR|nr:hypothetical protein BXZ70DRAFT_908019 [Cristinia sonorae]
MAGVARRIPRVTLFSSPTCSLCDGAKAILNEARQRHTFDLDVINIQEPGQERWYRRYRYWIPAIHLEGKEIAKGRFDSKPVLEVLEEWKQAQAEEQIKKDEVHLYHSGTDGVLGEAAGQKNAIAGRLCFNCGEPDHAVSSCPEPRDRELIALSRQMFEFYNDGPMMTLRQFGEATEWRIQRLRWLEEFQPGEVKGSDLRDALGLSGDDTGSYAPWLPRMADWGYPPGWVAVADPRLRVWDVITRDTEEEDQHDEDGNAERDTLVIFGEDTEPEIVTIPLRFGMGEVSRPIDDDDDHSSSDTLSSTDTPNANSPRPSIRRRWATYPDTYFSSELLPTYDGNRLPAFNLPSESNLYGHDYQAQSESFVSLGSPPPPPPCEPPPPLPPPPPGPPPPTPPPPPSEPPPPLPEPGCDEDSDMDMSD